MEHQKHRALALVEVMDTGAIDVLPVTLERVEVLVEPVRSFHGIIPL